jgi:hypothetical protein
MTKIDLRDRCRRAKCKKLIRKGAAAKAEFERYRPYCSYHCQQWSGIEDASTYLKTLECEK